VEQLARQELQDQDQQVPLVRLVLQDPQVQLALQVPLAEQRVQQVLQVLQDLRAYQEHLQVWEQPVQLVPQVLHPLCQAQLGLQGPQVPQAQQVLHLLYQEPQVPLVVVQQELPEPLVQQELLDPQVLQDLKASQVPLV
jgi:hypothetical protein